MNKCTLTAIRDNVTIPEKKEILNDVHYTMLPKKFTSPEKYLINHFKHRTSSINLIRDFCQW